MNSLTIRKPSLEAENAAMRVALTYYQIKYQNASTGPLEAHKRIVELENERRVNVARNWARTKARYAKRRRVQVGRVVAFAAMVVAAVVVGALN